MSSKRRTTDSQSLSPKSVSGGALPPPPPNLSKFLTEPSKPSSLLSRLDAFLPVMASANAALESNGASLKSSRMDATLVRVGEKDEAGGDEAGEGAPADISSLGEVEEASVEGGAMIELNVAVGEFDDSLYDKLGLGEKKQKEKPSSDPAPTTATESFISKKLNSSPTPT
eukprot:CAMPEP_0118660724 /NCGR_PEP_ID=MMETSP0785-20121206/15853_1 /TAXON_ID=91992 /ORGANISM="Bolidomonas pacifica, Strain CCMP 1866" /LENGTH=169 /DNA_ID=CAMNT_0006554025 /DNA_START=37 /DNA_END=542 /DNA_ORIENTATION=-